MEDLERPLRRGFRRVSPWFLIIVSSLLSGVIALSGRLPEKDRWPLWVICLLLVFSIVFDILKQMRPHAEPVVQRFTNLVTNATNILEEQMCKPYGVLDEGAEEDFSREILAEIALALEPRCKVRCNVMKEEGGTLRIKYSHPGPYSPEDFKLKVGKGAAGIAYGDCIPTYVPEVDARLVYKLHKVEGTYAKREQVGESFVPFEGDRTQMAAVLCMPLVGAGPQKQPKRFGVLNIDCVRKDAFYPEDFHMVEVFANLLTLFLQHAEICREEQRKRGAGGTA